MGRKKGDHQTSLRRRADVARAGLPSFCLPRHLVPSSNVCIVPLWELPIDDSWISCLCDADPADFSGLQEVQPGESEVAEESQCEDAESSNIAPPADSARLWSRVPVNKTAVCFRRLPGSPDAGGENCFVGVSSALFPHRLWRAASDAVLDEHFLEGLATRQPHWAVLALDGSGHFAGAIFRGPDAHVHKTFQRYTSRAKQGGSQAAFDARGKKASSAGSNMRRHHQQRLGEEIHELLTQTWAAELAACQKIFISVSNTMRSTLIGTPERSYVAFDRVSKLPFAVPRPTFEAISEAHRQVSGVVFCTESMMEKLMTKTLPPSAKADVCEQPDQFSTPLHIAAAAGDEDGIVELLQAGADPTSQDSKGRVPFDVCLSRGARRVFRFWREQHEEMWDWSAARVPGDKVGNQQTDPAQEKDPAKGKKSGRLKKSKRVQQNSRLDEADVSSPSVSSDTVRREGSFRARHQARKASKWRSFASSLSRTATAKSSPRHSAFLPRRSQAFSSPRRLTT